MTDQERGPAVGESAERLTRFLIAHPHAGDADVAHEGRVRYYRILADHILTFLASDMACIFCGGTGFEWQDYWSQDAQECRNGCDTTAAGRVDLAREVPEGPSIGEVYEAKSPDLMPPAPGSPTCEDCGGTGRVACNAAEHLCCGGYCPADAEPCSTCSAEPLVGRSDVRSDPIEVNRTSPLSDGEDQS